MVLALNDTLYNRPSLLVFCLFAFYFCNRKVFPFEAAANAPTVLMDHAISCPDTGSRQ